MATPPMIPKPTSKVELRFKCHKLKDLDVFSKSDPMIIVYHQDPRTNSWDRIGRTEMIKNNLSPEFKTPVKIDYFFEDIQNLRFTVVDVDTEDLDSIKDQDIIGEVSCTLSKIISQPGQTIEMDVLDKNKKFSGKLRVTCEELKSTNQNFRFRFGCVKLDKKDIFGLTDCYVLISRKTASGFAQIHQTEVVKNTLDPIFHEITMKLEDICGSGGDLNSPVKFDFYDWDKVGKHDYIGFCITTVNELMKTQNQVPIINEKKQKKSSSYKNSGTLKVFDAEIFRDYNFIEYLAGGCEISLIVGIDCTGSNGNPISPTSLHYQHPTQPNQYANAIVSIGNVLAPYDSDGLYPVYGFGGVIPGSNSVNHCFPFGLNPDLLYASGVGGILDVYYRNIKSIDLSGPTYFAPLIREAAKQATVPIGPNQPQKYTILLIITDGEILDMDNTIDAIIEASVLPMSIVIVGVGNASFDNMEILDGDDGVLSNQRGNRADRDIVQFVPMRKFTNQSFQMLASETLKEIPFQLVSFMKKYKIRPLPPRVFQPQPSVVIQQQQPQPIPPTQPIIGQEQPVNLNK